MKSWNMKLLLIFLFAAFLYCVMQARAQSAQAGSQEQSVKANTTTKSSRQGQGLASEGEKRFEAQCGRCHTPPEDLSPREARAVLRQMRVRALISAEDERLILKYIAP